MSKNLHRTFLSIGILAVATVAAAFFFFLNPEKILDNLTNEVIFKINVSKKKFPAKVTFQDVKLKSLNTVVWRNISVEMNVARDSITSQSGRFAMRAKSVTLTLVSFRKRAFLLEVEGIEAKELVRAEAYSDANVARTQKASIEKLIIAFSMDFLNRKKAFTEILKLYEGFESLLKNGQTSVPVDFSGKTYFKIKDDYFIAGIKIVRIANASVLIMQKADIKAISEELGEELNESEIGLFSRNPLRVPRLLQIKGYAFEQSEKAHKKNSDIPEDAYRHILWSYLLTRAYGPTFAEKVTNSHEEGNTGNTMLETKMDLVNNEIGRSYALEEYAESEIIKIMMQNPKVIRIPQEAGIRLLR